MAGISAVHWQVVEHVFLRAGFEFARQKGTHRSYVKEGRLRPIIIPESDEVPVAVIRNAIRNAGLSREEYLRLLPG